MLLYPIPSYNERQTWNVDSLYRLFAWYCLWKLFYPSKAEATLVLSAGTHLNPVMLVIIRKLSLSTLRWVLMCQGFRHFSGFLLILYWLNLPPAAQGLNSVDIRMKSTHLNSMHTANKSLDTLHNLVDFGHIYHMRYINIKDNIQNISSVHTFQENVLRELLIIMLSDTIFHTIMLSANTNVYRTCTKDMYFAG